jgi:ribosomal protein S24E
VNKMDIKITEQKKVPLYSREEITARISFQGPTPRKEKILQKIAAELKADENLIQIEKVENDFGFSGAKISAFLYESEEMKKSFSPKLGKKALEKIKAEEEKKAAELAKAKEQKEKEKLEKEEKAKETAEEKTEETSSNEPKPEEENKGE